IHLQLWKLWTEQDKHPIYWAFRVCRSSSYWWFLKGQSELSSSILIVTRFPSTHLSA
ncbi:hypothetical protein HHX47_DHR3000423, partial [Lentinula edodes]